MKGWVSHRILSKDVNGELRSVAITKTGVVAKVLNMDERDNRLPANAALCIVVKAQLLVISQCDEHRALRYQSHWIHLKLVATTVTEISSE